MSVICDNALLSGFALGRRPVGSDIVAEVIRDFDMAGGPAAEPPPQPAPTNGGQLLVAEPRPVSHAPAAEPPGSGSAAEGMFQGVARPRRRFSLFG